MASRLTTDQPATTGHSLFHYLPLISAPALQPSNLYQEDWPLLKTRTLTSVALSAIGSAGLFFISPPAALLTAMAAPLFLGVTEVLRADSTANQNAVEHYKKEEKPSEEALFRISLRPKLIQALFDQKQTLHKGLGESVFLREHFSPKAQEMLLERSDEFFLSYQDPNELFRVLVRQPLLINQGSLALLEKILTSQDPTIQKIVQEFKSDSYEVLKEVTSPKILQLLCRYGFNIHAADAQGMTLLMNWLQREDHYYRNSLCSQALNLGANPLLTNLEGKKASDYVPPQNPAMKGIFLQAEAEAKSDGSPLSLPEGEKGFFSYVLRKPLAIKKKTEYSADNLAIFSQVQKINLAALGIFAALIFLPAHIITFSAVKVCCNILTSTVFANFFLGLVDIKRSEKEAKRLAVHEYLTTPVPSKQAMYTISNHLDVAEMLVSSLAKKSPLLNRRNVETGKTLLSETTDPQIFKLLASHGADLYAEEIWDFPLLNLIKANEMDHLQYLDEQDLLHPPENKDLQAAIWLAIPSKEIAELLRKKGFNPNEPNSQGKTPLELLMDSKRGLSDAVSRVRLGADPSKIIAKLATSPDSWGARFIKVLESAQNKPKAPDS